MKSIGQSGAKIKHASFCSYDLQFLQVKKQKMTTISAKRRFSQVQTKELFKIALEKRPKSIYTLKQSLHINTVKYQQYADCLNRSTDIFHTNYSQAESQKEEQELIAAYQKYAMHLRNMNKAKQAKFFKEPTRKLHKNMDRLLIRRKISNHTQNEPQPRPNSEYLKIKRPLSMVTTKDKILAFYRHKHSVSLSQNLQQSRHQPTGDILLSPSDKFWRKVGACRFKDPPQRSKTQSDQKIGQNTLGDMTQYSKSKESKAANFLILQLQLNINNTKRARRSAGLPQ